MSDECPITERVPVSPRTGWRKIQLADVSRGTVVRLKGLHGCYNTATIIAVVEQEHYSHVLLARPMAIASKDYNNKQPTLHCEVFEMGIGRMLQDDSDVEVFQQRETVHTMVTG